MSKSHFSTIDFWSESQDYPFINSYSRRDYFLIIKLYHYDDVTFRLSFTDQSQLDKFLKGLYLKGFELKVKGLNVELKSDTDTNKEVPTIQISGDTTDYKNLKPKEMEQMYYTMSKQFKRRVKKELKSLKESGKSYGEDLGTIYYFEKEKEV